MPRRSLASKLLVTTAFALVAGAASSALAQTASGVAEVETLIVTANKRAENIQDVPMSVTAVSGEFLEKTGVANVTELARFIPSVSISQSNNNRNTTVFVRGIGTSGTNPGIESSVGIFIDGVYILAAGPIQGNLQDISTVEVLRGPQGTLYGRNTPVGAINITSREPTQTFEAQLTARAGNYEDRGLSGYVGGGLTESLAGRLSFWVSDRDGYETNLFDGDDVNGSEQWGVRGRLKWQPRDGITGNFIGYYARLEANCCTPETLAASTPTGIATPGFLTAAQAVGRPFRNFNDRDHVVDDDVEGDNNTDVYGVSATFDIDLPGGHTLTSITAFNGYEDKIVSLAADGLPQNTATGSQRLRAEGYSEELRIASPADQRVSYLAGVYLFSETLTYTSRTVLGLHANRVLPPARRFTPGDTGIFYYTQDTQSWALFGQATFNVTDSFRLVGGLRYSYDKKNAFLDGDVNPTASPAARTVFPVNHLGKVKRNEDKITWSATVQYDVTPDVMLYALAATGYKTGGYNARSSAVGVPVEFDAENSETIEVGMKSLLLDNRLVLNVDAYRMKLKDFQDSILNPLTGSGFIVANAGDRRVQGVEADAEFRPIRELTIKGSLGYMDAEFTDYTAGQCYAGQPANGTSPGTCNYNGKTPSHSPKWTWSLAGQYQRPLAGTGLEIFVNADVSYTSSKFLEPLLDPRGLQDSVTLVGLRVGLTPEKGNWRISAYGKNIFDRDYFAQATLQPLNAFISAGGTAQAQGFVGWYAPPRTYGIEATVKF
ncbi:MAG: TonB-dependent receptor [Phenylobacterium sp.]|uniref:TonB-dependent receptor n=1 Tax=Phenylobacterium sp. TaxID=1871053 RepID=UPI001A4FF3AF|nr:TonB-dependent receptor [Phenylobacterium sp.]MBL8773002.1 TonB-dependent receptor [Phenylobacterium sp.]